MKVVYFIISSTYCKDGVFGWCVCVQPP